ncbi:MAG: dicarboxylate/amino acid:cation symporter, partial [Gemmatimonadales bacterium]
MTGLDLTAVPYFTALFIQPNGITMTDDQRPSDDESRDRFEREITTDLDDKTDDRPKGMALHSRILLGLVLGAAAGLAGSAILGPDDPRLAWVIHNLTEPVGTLFLTLLLMTVIPLVFSALVVGVAGVGDVRKIGRIGIKAFAYTLVISGISVVIGLTLANTIRPGERIAPETAAALEAEYGMDAAERVSGALVEGTDASVLMQVVETLVPSNPVTAAASETPNLLHLMFFALVLGIAATLVPTETAAPLLRVLEALYEISVKIIEGIMKFAPYAV